MLQSSILTIEYQYTNVLKRIFTKVVYLLRKQHVVFHAKERPCDKCQRTFSTFASPNSQADASACKRAKFLPTHFDSIYLNNMIQENKWKRRVDF